MKLLPFFAAALSLMAVVPAFAQGQDFSKVEEKVTNLGHGLYAVTGAGGNTTIAVGSDAVVVVDTQFAPVYDKLKAAISGLSPFPVKYVINTHYHGDHTGGNEAFAKAGATLVAYETVPDRMLHPFPGPNGPVPPAPAGAIPTKLYFRQQHDSDDPRRHGRSGASRASPQRYRYHRDLEGRECDLDGRYCRQRHLSQY